MIRYAGLRRALGDNIEVFSYLSRQETKAILPRRAARQHFQSMDHSCGKVALRHGISEGSP